jgi:hypothetical protein
MNLRLNSIQKQIINSLLDKYENSKSYTGQNVVTQNYYLFPTNIYKDYESDFADVDLVQKFEDAVFELQKEDLISVEKKNGAIMKIVAIKDAISWYYDLVNRREICEIQDDQINYYRSCIGTNSIIDKFCSYQIERLSIGKKATYEFEVASNVIRIVNFILRNDKYILEREMSIALLNDSKLFTTKYRSRVCKVLKEYGIFEDLLKDIDEKQFENVLLEEHKIFSNPSYVYFKGSACINFKDGTVLNMILERPIALSSETLDSISNIVIYNPTIMTVENLTSYNRLNSRETFYIFLSGYHNSLKQKFLIKLEESNQGKKWCHFGDLDPDGFYILLNLREKTRIDFVPAYMSLEYLIKYQKYSKPLESNDITKPKSLLKAGEFANIMQYMLDKNCKLEQEIISWSEQEW